MAEIKKPITQSNTTRTVAEGTAVGGGGVASVLVLLRSLGWAPWPEAADEAVFVVVSTVVIPVVSRVIARIKQAMAKRRQNRALGTAGLVLALVGASLLCGGCATTITPDGSRTTSVDVDAARLLMADALAVYQSLDEQRAAAEAAEDAQEAERLRLRMQVLESILDSLRDRAYPGASAAPY